jgi:CheY-like chemotaxis protein
LAFLLQANGAKVTTAASVFPSLTNTTTTLPDILLSDIGMPEMDGMAIA